MIGRTISHYQITEQLGQGGMGVVYKAQDTRLDRTVALKFLSPHSLPTDAEKARFYREAKAAAKLHHPHIATVFEIDETDDGQAFIVMEYVEGETLAEKIKRGPLKLEEAITIVCQVVEGLQAAHEAGIVHRDIKSSNIMLTAKSQVKVMDFGLAKVEAASMLTKEGTTLGTVSYMSPEQARGEEVDHRSDIWSLGVVLYEMVTGRLPFGGDYEQAMVYSILNQDPQPLTALRTGVPMALDWVMAKLLAKDPARRYQHADEVVVDLKAIEIEATGLSQASLVAATSGTMTARPASSGLERSLAAGAAPKAPLSWKIRLPIATALLLVGVLMGWFLRPGPPTPDKQVIPFSVLLPEDVQVSNTGRHSIALSPDGSYVAYIANSQVYLASLDDLESVHPLRGTPGREVFFSPDSRWIGFRNRQTDQLMKVAVTGDSPVPLTTTAELLFGAMWAEDGMIYYGQGPEGLYRVSENGGESERILAPDSADAGQTLHGPQLLPDGRQVLFTLRPGSTQDWDESQIMILSLETGTTIRLLAGTDDRYV